VTHFKFWASNDISGMVEARIVKFAHMQNVSNPSLWMTNHPKMAWPGSRDPFSMTSKFWEII